MKLGLSSFSYGWAIGVRGFQPPRPLDELGLLDKCRELDVKLLQVGDNLPLHTFNTTRLAKFADRAAQEGVELEVGARGLTRQHVGQYASIARRIGANLIRFVIDDAEHRPKAEEVVSVLREVVSELECLTLGIENHDRFPAAVLRSIVQATGSERVGVCLDTANSLGSGEGIEAVAAQLAPFTVNLHVKDFVVERAPHLMGFSVQGRPAGEGMMDIPSLLRQVAAHGRCATAVLELWTPPESNVEATIAKEARWAEASLEYLKPLFSNLRSGVPPPITSAQLAGAVNPIPATTVDSGRGIE